MSLYVSIYLKNQWIITIVAIVADNVNNYCAEQYKIILRSIKYIGNTVIVQSQRRLYHSQLYQLPFKH